MAVMVWPAASSAGKVPWPLLLPFMAGAGAEVGAVASAMFFVVAIARCQVPSVAQR
jgi:hypothetical protein